MAEKHVCTFCGFIYDESLGLVEAGIPSGTRWEEVPDDWVCPDCANDKASFQLQDW
jgi:rubredoxin